MPFPVRIGVDLGGTKIEAACLDEKGAILARVRHPTPKQGYEAIVLAIASIVRELEANTGRTGSVGIGTPGSVSPWTGLMRNSNTTCINGRYLKTDVEAELGREVRLANDANCFALSEATDGAGQDAATVFGVILGTGTGGGVVINKKILEGANGVAGEWGHSPLPWPTQEEQPGESCYCGKRGCIETWLAGPSLERECSRQSGQYRTAEEIASAVDAADPTAIQCFHEYVGRLARSLATVVNLLDPESIVLGGGLSNMLSLYPRIQPELRKWVFSDNVRTRIVRAKHGDSSGVRGAAWLW